MSPRHLWGSFPPDWKMVGWSISSFARNRFEATISIGILGSSVLLLDDSYRGLAVSECENVCWGSDRKCNSREKSKKVLGEVPRECFLNAFGEIDCGWSGVVCLRKCLLLRRLIFWSKDSDLKSWLGSNFLSCDFLLLKGVSTEKSQN